MFIVRCDLCFEDSAEVRFTTIALTYEGAPKNPPGDVWLYPTPPKWERVLGKMCCEACVAKIKGAMAGIESMAEI